MKAVRPIRVEGSVAYVQLTKGFTAVVDAADVPLVAGFNWSATLTPNSVYALRTCQVNGRRETVMLHRVILGAPKGVDVDHANGDGLDNRRCNLRLATPSQNGFNARLSCRNKSGVKGVSWAAREGKWQTHISAGGKNIHLGHFSSIEEAAAVRAKAAQQLHGEFARSL